MRDVRRRKQTESGEEEEKEVRHTNKTQIALWHREKGLFLLHLPHNIHVMDAC